MESEEWRVESEEWRVESGEWRVGEDGSVASFESVDVKRYDKDAVRGLCFPRALACGHGCGRE